MNTKRAVLLVLSVIFACSSVLSSDVMSPQYWKKQALEQIIPFWEKSIDRDYGGFFTDVETDGTVSFAGNKYTRMNSRLLYAFCAAYMLSGEDKYLDLAAHAFNFMSEYCHDREYGGWHTTIDERGNPDGGYKNLFDMTYGNLGPVYYYFVTGNKKALALVSETHSLMNKNAWDSEYGGYFAHVGPDWRRSTSKKSFNSQIDTFTAYLLYYYLAVRDKELMSDIRRLAEVTVSKMIDKKSSYVGEQFLQDWTWDDTTLWAGHNLKTGWVLSRVYYLTGDKKYITAADKIAKAQIARTWDSLHGGWFFRFDIDPKSPADTTKDWWTQEEGNMLMLNLYPQTSAKDYLDKFEKTSQFWDEYFIDKEFGECWQALHADGRIKNRVKADSYKSAYHTMEQALFSYLYLNLYINKTEAELYFRFDTAEQGEIRYLNPVEAPWVRLKSVTVNGEDWKDFDAKECSVKLPKGEKIRVKAVLI